MGDANARTFTIDSNANVAYVIGTIIEFVNMSASAVTIAITSDTGTTNIVVANNSVTNSKAGLVFNWTGTAIGVEYYSNNITYCSTGIIVSPTTSGDTSSYGILIHDNTVDNNYVWDGVFLDAVNHFHSDGIHLFGITGATPSISVYNNRVGPNIGIYFTGNVFLENGASHRVYNNVLTAGSGSSPANGFVALKSCTGTSYAVNNTIINVTGGTGVYSTADGVVIEGNITAGASMTALSIANSATITRCNKNVWGTTGTLDFYIDAGFYNWTTWRALNSSTYDQNSLNTPSGCNTTTGALSAGSNAIDLAPTQSFFSTDILGNARSGAWDAGAYEYGGLGTAGGSQLLDKSSTLGKISIF